MVVLNPNSLPKHFASQQCYVTEAHELPSPTRPLLNEHNLDCIILHLSDHFTMYLEEGLVLH